MGTPDLSQIRPFMNQLGSNTPATATAIALANDIPLSLVSAAPSLAPLAAPIVVTGAASAFPATGAGDAWVPVGPPVVVTVVDASRPVSVSDSLTSTVVGAAGAGSPGGGNARVVLTGPSPLAGILLQQGTATAEPIPAGTGGVPGTLFLFGQTSLALPVGTYSFQLQASNATSGGSMTIPAGIANAPQLAVSQP
jgi:hypothetical protein